ncbi:50S ribosomal protein L11 methyltransferase [Chitinophaga horti]|uniref:Ribosomal protein L11 methyltransferase n=1 Tax=Chitinophaga horti TaxID=2920382 RepID=A0ABY6J089_9BACT|nr:50S ribosomal protein L11 methyltransferase [Chitinophaga horti]UYQ91562.1 50S ribosomal protein L11 methyltransferase [Chitinophaga horti]
MSHIAITISLPDELKDILIAQLADAEYEGFEETHEQLVAYIPEGLFDEQALNAVLAPHLLKYTKESIANTNWNAVWESNFEPVQVEGFCGIRADFHAPMGQSVQHEIVITPKMSFGTGHHATTYSMIKLMQDIDFQGKIVFDFGTGTGILAILAEKLGAVKADAIDIDEWAVNNSIENVAANESTKVAVWQADSLEAINGPYDIVLANINRNILLRFMQDMRRLLPQDGILLLSGFLTEDEAVITKSALDNGFEFERKAQIENWLAMQFKVKNN